VHESDRPSLRQIASAWLRLGVTGFGGPPAHIVLLRKLCVEDNSWIDQESFEHAVAATNLLPGPASTQLAIYLGWRLRATKGALVAGLCFILPGLTMILALAALLLEAGAPRWITGAAVGAGAVVPVVAVRAGADLALPSLRRWPKRTGPRARWLLWVLAGLFGCLFLGPALVLCLLACGIIEMCIELARAPRPPSGTFMLAPLLAVTPVLGGVAWLALKVGALSFGGGFVIVPLMQSQAVHTAHWMTESQFLAAVALGQLTPGPVVQTVAVVGWAAGGLGAALLAATIAFAPSFLFVIGLGSSFERLRTSRVAQGFMSGAGPAAIGAIFGSAVILCRGLGEVWQLPLLGLAVLWLLVLRRGPMSMLLFAALVGGILGALGAPLSF